MQIGFMGLGNMGLNMVKNLLDHKHEVVAWNRSPEPRSEAAAAGAVVVENLKDFKEKLTPKRIVISMISAGPAIDTLLFDNMDNTIYDILQEGDIFIDGVNSHYKDSIRRSQKLSEKGIIMLDAGISGGIEGARHGACAMVGGDEAAFKHVEQIFKDLTIENGYGYFGQSGAGHFVKMVHNAIEYGMMEVIGEGMNLISESEFKPDLLKLLDVWNHGSIIQGKLVGFLKDALANTNGQPANLESEIGSLGTGRWASEDALQRGVPFTAITHAVFNRYQSRGTGEFAFKIIQAMRAEFGGHTGAERDAQ